ncbi:putative glyoxylate reductase [Clavispora lusitaniae]|uniref:Glyoxylate reductase n=3 Tax=Clavispora lusitaniae TaxID=36911 RepID=C4Y4F5_CLAL4|nr:uncharacterized protein CLUG_02527 [Clavispora lusitaniae ATCC 42720]KAF5211367.1 hypothetical protein E0198_002673 [Clavispora lusitaniae]EEQ38401.1 hypothetical protein CLUG_02527 [Clavispora lusitaniae ATCC 42720]KAF7580202.1 Glyoxylate reductase 1 [Clavispora lusitaniae]OVF08857.1 putative glyoxylate reductase [Clavispora lusitaniae]QFZ27764.1 putative glyoxylate reductase [Clavispora lusitaniae]
MPAIKPKVLRLGPWDHSKKQWAELAKVADIIDCDSKNREQFIKDLQGKYSDVTNIARTFSSISQTGRFDAELVSKLPKSVLSVAHCGAGYDQVDPQALTDRNIQLSNVTTPVEAPTALTAVYLTLAAMRNFQAGHDAMVEGKWPSQKCAGAQVGWDPQGKIVGILGMGGIGRAIRDRLRPFGFEKIIYYNRSRLSADLEEDAEYVSLEELYSQSDVIMVSVPLNANTRHMIDADTISSMKDGVIIVNTARGAVIDEAAITEALKKGKVGAFGSDVFEHEPEVAEELRKMHNVVSLPHMGTHTYQAMENLEIWVVDNLRTYFETGKVKTIVPEQSKVDFGHSPML